MKRNLKKTEMVETFGILAFSNHFLEDNTEK